MTAEDYRDPIVELYVGGDWRDVTGDVRHDAGLVIERGRGSEDETSPPQTCRFTLDNATGDYSPRNPLGAYHGSIGRNTPVRVHLPLDQTAFDTVVTDDWPATDDGWPWTHFGSSSVLASDWQGTGAGATHRVSATASIRLSYIDRMLGDVDLAVTVSTSAADVTGGNLEPANVLVRRAGGIYYYLRLTVTPAEEVTVDLRRTGDVVIASQVSLPALDPAYPMRVRVQAEGLTLRAKAWPADQPEPYEWALTGYMSDAARTGAIGIRSGVGAGNTNIPVTYTYTDLVVRVPRYTGEVSSWPPQWDTSGVDATTPVQAAGILQRLNQGSSQLRSTLYRGAVSLARRAVEYWPCEDESSATSLASAQGGTPMRITGAPRLSSNSEFAASSALPTLVGSTWVGDVPAYTGTGEIQVRFLMRVPDSGEVDDTIIARLGVGGTGALWELIYVTGGALTIKAYNGVGTNVLTDGPVGFQVNGKLLWVSIELGQVGSDVSYNVATLQVGSSVGLVRSGTLAGHRVDRLLQVQINPEAVLDQTVLGHVLVQDEITSLFDLHRQLNAWTGETAGRRMERVCAEEDIPFGHIGNLDDTPAMGPQQAEQLLAILAACAAADLGTLYESRGDLGLAYRTRRSLHNQDPGAALDMDGSQVTPPWRPVDDDRYTRNDVTTRRTGGSSYRAVLESGPLSVLPPADGGAGRYDTSRTVDVQTDAQLAGIAWWLVHLGTWDEARYPQIVATLTKGEIGSDLVLQLLNLDIDDRLVIQNAVLAHTYRDVSQLVRGYTETIKYPGHTLVFDCSPEGPYQVVQLDSSTLGKLDARSSYLDAGIDETTTSLPVATDDGLWTTDPAHMPIPITIGGEDMSVTAVTGTTSPQTMTVVRSVNGVVKDHPEDTPVRLTRRATLAL